MTTPKGPAKKTRSSKRQPDEAKVEATTPETTAPAGQDPGTDEQRKPQNEEESPEEVPAGAPPAEQAPLAADAGDAPAAPEPGDDDVTLPAIPPEWSVSTTDRPRTEIDREYDLPFYLYLMPEHHSLPAEKKENLVGALYRECDTVKEIVQEHLRQIDSLSADGRLQHLRQYQDLCRRLVGEARKTLDTGNLDVAVAAQLVQEHLDLAQQMGLVLKLDHDILVKRAENARAQAPKSRPGGVFSFLLKAGEVPSLPPNIAAVAKAVDEESDGNGQEKPHIDLGQWKKGGCRNLMQDLLEDDIRAGVTTKDRRHGKHQPKELRRSLRETYKLPQVADAIQHVKGKARTYKLTIPRDRISYKSPRT